MCFPVSSRCPRVASAVYGITVKDPDLVLLLRHRAIVLVLVGIGLIIGAFTPPHQTSGHRCRADQSGQLHRLDRVCRAGWRER